MSSFGSNVLELARQLSRSPIGKDVWKLSNTAQEVREKFRSKPARYSEYLALHDNSMTPLPPSQNWQRRIIFRLHSELALV